MNEQTTLCNLDAWRGTLDVLIQHLDAADKNASREGVFVLLLQGLGFFGIEGPMMHLFPVVDSIKGKIEKSSLDAALRQATLFRQQLDEVRALVSSGAASAEQGARSAQRSLFEAEQEP
jgi:hypothetical protein